MQRALESGTMIAGYRVEFLLGEGATGAVSLARDRDRLLRGIHDTFTEGEEAFCDALD